MSRYVDKVTYKLNLADDLDEISRNQRKKALEEVGTFLVESILEGCGQSKSTVAGGKWKQDLSEKYLKRKKQESSSGKPNMELTGDMLDALTFKIVGSSVEVGIFDYNQAQKADNHNKFSSASQGTAVPQRQFIPNGNNGEKFRRDIVSEINQILEEFKDGAN